MPLFEFGFRDVICDKEGPILLAFLFCRCIAFSYKTSALYAAFYNDFNTFENERAYCSAKQAEQ